MDITRAIQVAVARADLLACQALALPWRRIALSITLSTLVIHIVKAVRNDG